MSELISIREYGRRRGVSDTAVHKAIRAGKIPTVNGKIDPAAADAAWTRNRDATQASKMAAAASAGPASDASAAPPAAGEAAALHTSATSPVPAESHAPAEGTIAHAQLQVLAAKAEKAQLDLQERKGEVIAVEEVEQVGSEIVETVKNRLLLIPDGIADRLAAIKEPLECRSILLHEITVALEELSRLGSVAA